MRSTRMLTVIALVAASFTTVSTPPAHAATTSRPHQLVAGFSTPDGGGYWLVYDDGTVVPKGDARWCGGATHLPLVSPIVGGAPTPNGRGYWLAAADGGVFAFGNARFYGSAASLQLVGPVFDIAPTQTGNGYWLIARDGGVFAFGDAHFYGSASGRAGEPVVGAVTTRGDKGYELLTRGGGHFDFGKVLVRWPARGFDHAVTIVGVAPSPSHEGFWALQNFGDVAPIGLAPFLGPVRVQGGAKFIFSNPVHYGYVVIANSGALVRIGQAPGR